VKQVEFIDEEDGLGKYGRWTLRLWLEQQRTYLQMLGGWTRKYMASEVLKIISEARFQVLDSSIMALRSQIDRLERQRKGHSRWHAEKAKLIENRESVTMDFLMVLLEYMGLEIITDESGKRITRKKGDV
jgi:hypothetical protein